MKRGALLMLPALVVPVAAKAQDSLQPPAGVIERPVTVGPLGLPGTLTMPAGERHLPGVVLVQGSGAADRDETIGPNKPFRDLAWGLAARGVVVLRYEKRSKAHPFSFIGRRFTVREEVVEDAVAALTLLRNQPEVDPGRVVVLGHSLGGMLAPRIAEAARGTAGMIIMAGPTASITAMIARQARYLAEQGKAESARTAPQLAALDNLAARIDSLTPADTLSTALLLGAPPSYWLDLRNYHPEALADSLALPMLILRGARDYQVIAADAAGWRARLGSRKDVRFIEYPGLNHLFLEGSGPPSPSEYAIPGHVPTRVLDDIAGWLRSLPPRPAPHPSGSPSQAP